MSAQARLIRKTVRTTARHTASGVASRFTRRPLRSVTLLALGATLGGIVGWLIGRAGGGERPDPVAASASAAVTDHTGEVAADGGHEVTAVT